MTDDKKKELKTLVDDNTNQYQWNKLLQWIDENFIEKVGNKLIIHTTSTINLPDDL